MRLLANNIKYIKLIRILKKVKKSKEYKKNNFPVDIKTDWKTRKDKSYPPFLWYLQKNTVLYNIKNKKNVIKVPVDSIFGEFFNRNK